MCYLGGTGQGTTGPTGANGNTGDQGEGILLLQAIEALLLLVLLVIHWLLTLYNHEYGMLVSHGVPVNSVLRL